MEIRIPQKSNSIEKKERLAETCYYLACSENIDSITSATICDRAKVSIGTFYSYFKNKEDILLYAIEKYSKPILFPILSNINLLKFNKDNILKLLNKMINISTELHTMTKESHPKIMSIIYSSSNFYNIYTKLFNEEVDTIYNKCLQNNFKDENLKETIYTTLNLLENFVHNKTFNKQNFVDYDKQKLLLTQTLLKLWNTHI